ncbi:MAG: FAD-binding oxidoreductase, partial [bacterium]|nr:FAD-binding oxidoreductase [bacterium]
MVVELLVSVGVACLITGLLALLIVIAGATIADYGEVTVSVNKERKLTVRGGKPLLATLKDEKIFIPSACGGRGSCGLCKVKVLKGAGDILPTELPWLDADEKKEGVRLSCQLKVKRDFSIKIPEELFKVKQYQTEVTAVKDLTYDIKEITLKLLEPAEMSFKAGQFIQFEVPPYELTDEPVYRAYSIASAPDETNSLQLEIRLVPNGICTTYVHKYIKTGDRITINGPYGDFYLRDTGRDIIFMA